LNPFVSAFNDVMSDVFVTACAKGWHDKPREVGTEIALVHSELSELLEGLRHGNPPSEHIPEFSAAEEEVADVVIRLLDMSKKHGWRIAEAIVAKAEFNRGREHKHGGKAF
jgi:NTP pyrophosphatase (non-canonical NTP hydrolase)